MFDACRKGDIARVQTYVDGNGCVNDPDEQKMTMFHHAAFSGNIDVLKLLLSVGEKQKINLDAEDVDGWTALHYASEKGHADVVALLLEEGANINAKDAMKKTPLILAAAGGKEDVVKALLQHGASKAVKSVSGWDAKRYAEEGNHAGVLALM